MRMHPGGWYQAGVPCAVHPPRLRGPLPLLSLVLYVSVCPPLRVPLTFLRLLCSISPNAPTRHSSVLWAALCDPCSRSHRLQRPHCCTLSLSLAPEFTVASAPVFNRSSTVFDNRRYALTLICVCNWDCVHCLASTVCDSCVTHFGSLCCTSPLRCGRSQVWQRGGSVVASHPHASRQHPHPVAVPLPGGNCDGQHQQGDTEGHPAARREGASKVPVCTPLMCAPCTPRH
jgi:hypothetical protein